MKKIGHTGTLDPDAEGVLPVCLGTGTRLCDLLTNKSKTYQAVLLLGQITDTQDVSGKVLAECGPVVDIQQVEAAVLGFTGSYNQIPPMYSALKVNGKKLYELARAGKEVERQPRAVEIYSIEINQIELPRVTITVSCSKGTYIRTLCHDIGQELGCGGCMESLLRLRVGGFDVKDSLTLDQIETFRDAGLLETYIMPVEDILSEYPQLTMNFSGDKLVHNGNPFSPENVQGNALPLPGWVRVYDSSRHFIGIYEYDSEKKRYQPRKMFLSAKI